MCKMKKSHRTVAPQKPLPPVRACIFHVNGLLLNPEDIYTEIFREALRENVGAHLPPVPWTITALRKSTGRSVRFPFRLLSSLHVCSVCFHLALPPFMRLLISRLANASFIQGSQHLLQWADSLDSPGIFSHKAVEQENRLKHAKHCQRLSICSRT